MLDQDVEVCDVLVLGAGVGGLAAASQLGRRAIVLERADRPGGLVRTECFNGYWFDHVVHLLYFPDEDTERRIRAVMGDLLVPCPPEAWVETKVGTTRYPLQMHLGALPPKCVLRCLQDLANVTFNSHADQPPRNFEQMLERTFGRALCELFFFPYNRKVWKRPLDELAPSGFTWTITHPEFDDVLAGALLPNCRYRSYNAAGYYPQSRIGAPLRGMELLSHRLATSVHDLRLGHRVDSIDLERREVTVHDGVGQRRFRYRQCCCCSLPLPRVLDMCVQTPAGLRAACRGLVCNRVLSVAVSVRGERPEGRGHWRYYADESIIFTRLVYMHEFDPHLAPPDGWGVLAEIVEPAEADGPDHATIIDRVCRDLERVGALPPECTIIDARVLVVDPAYVVFTRSSCEVVKQAHAFLREHDIEPIGRYGRWEYSSMGQVMRDAFRWADERLASCETIETTHARRARRPVDDGR